MPFKHGAKRPKPVHGQHKTTEAGKTPAPEPGKGKPSMLGIGGMGDPSRHTMKHGTMKEKVKAKPNLAKALMKYK